MFSIFSSNEQQPINEGRLRRIEQKLDLILAHLGLAHEPSAGLPEEVRDLADSGLKIRAIKAHRQLTGSGLREAKDEVEAYLAKK